MIGQRRKKQQHATNSGFQVIAGCDKVAVALEAARPTKERPRSRSASDDCDTLASRLMAKAREGD